MRNFYLDMDIQDNSYKHERYWLVRWSLLMMMRRKTKGTCHPYCFIIGTNILKDWGRVFPVGKKFWPWLDEIARQSFEVCHSIVKAPQTGVPIDPPRMPSHFPNLNSYLFNALYPFSFRRSTGYYQLTYSKNRVPRGLASNSRSFGSCRSHHSWQL